LFVARLTGSVQVRLHLCQAKQLFTSSSIKLPYIDCQAVWLWTTKDIIHQEMPIDWNNSM